MAILNITPDSFSGDGCLKKSLSLKSIIQKAEHQLKEGAHILDVGGESTRPGSNPVSVQEEIKRVVPVIKALRKITRKPLSIDTYKPEVALAALKAGASMVNNILGTHCDEDLLKTVKKFDAAIVLMHIRGKPKTMQKNIRYKSIVKEIIRELKKSAEKCLEIGIKSDRIIIDPGIGFGKTVEHNLKILQQLDKFHCLNLPLLIGTSRKSFIGKVLKQDVCHRMLGTAASVAVAISRGVHIIRVHDVREMKQVVRLSDAICFA